MAHADWGDRGLLKDDPCRDIKHQGRASGHGYRLKGSALQHLRPWIVKLINGPKALSYVAGTENFYAITRYNWSSYYAMAVIELAQMVGRKMQYKR
jgi:membrane-bound lytic murein transglycosylase B